MIADELNPLTISHIDRINSPKPTGGPKKIMIFDEGIRPNIPNKAPVNNNAGAMIHQTDINRGMSLDLYNI